MTATLSVKHAEPARATVAIVLAKVRTKRQRRQFVDMATSGTELPSSLSHLQVSSKKRQKVSKALDRATTRNKRR